GGEVTCSLQPGVAWRRLTPGRAQVVHHGAHVADQGNVNGAIATQTLRGDVHLEQRLLGAEQRRAPVHEVRVERGAQHQHAVARGYGKAAMQQRAETPRMRVGDDAARRAGGDHRDLRLLRKGSDLLAGSRPERTAAGAMAIWSMSITAPLPWRLVRCARR